MQLLKHAPKLAALAVAMLWSASAQAASDPSGIWIDADKRGAVEISPCASGVGMCGYVVYVFDPKNAKNCGMQILNEVTPSGGGWIYSPQRKNRYDVRLKRLSDDELRVTGNANSRFFSRTFIWHRAPDNVVKCSDKTAAAKPATGATKTETKGGVKEESTLVPASASDAEAPASEAKAAADDTTVAASNVKEEPAGTKATDDWSKADDSDVVSGKRKTCKYRIPYINRTISAPCRQ